MRGVSVILFSNKHANIGKAKHTRNYFKNDLFRLYVFVAFFIHAFTLCDPRFWQNTGPV